MTPYELYQKVFPGKDYSYIVAKEANKLLQALFIPTDDGWKMDATRLDLFGINTQEPINFGDLSASVEKRDKIFYVTIEEAMADYCPTLCAYIEKHLKVMGIEVEVVTEW